MGTRPNWSQPDHNAGAIKQNLRTTQTTPHHNLIKIVVLLTLPSPHSLYLPHPLWAFLCALWGKTYAHQEKSMYNQICQSNDLTLSIKDALLIQDLINRLSSKRLRILSAFTLAHSSLECTQIKIMLCFVIAVSLPFNYLSWCRQELRRANLMHNIFGAVTWIAMPAIKV